jgi:hypothetical protein
VHEAAGEHRVHLAAGHQVGAGRAGELSVYLIQIGLHSGGAILIREMVRR